MGGMSKKETGSSQEPGSSKEFSYALDMVAVFSRMDLLLVPRAPTSAMLDAGAAAGNISADEAARIYTAMTASEA
jgi:hypothetical protein